MPTLIDSRAASDADPLEPGLLPADPFYLEISPDRPSSPGVRPFGLTRTVEVLPKDFQVIDGDRYDPVRQVTVDRCGRPIAAERKQPTFCQQNTKEDGQTWPDQNTDD